MKDLHGYRVSFFRGTDDLSDLFSAWRTLALRIDDPGFVQLPDWIGSFLAADRKGLTGFAALMISVGAVPVGILPLESIKLKRFGFTLAVWRLYWPNDMGVNDIVTAHSDENRFLLDVVVAYLTERPEPFDLLILQNAPEDGSVAHLMALRRPADWFTVFSHESKYIPCLSRYEETTAGLSGAFRRNNRRKLKNLQKLGEITYESIGDPDGLITAFEEFVRTEAANWKGELKTALRYDHSRHRFYEELRNRFGRIGQCQIDVLRLDSRPIAVQFCIISGSTYNLLKIGFDQEFRSQSPGVLLLDWTLRKYSGHPTIKKISFVTGAKWNDDWAPSPVRVFDHWCYAPTVRGRAARVLENVKQLLKTLYDSYRNQFKERH